MPERGTIAQPGQAPAVEPTAGAMVAALYGQLTPRPGWPDDLAAHALFYNRSLAMGWLDESSDGTGPRGLWAMNDAGWQHPRGEHDTGLISWFQVDATTPPSDRPLPIQPFLRCACDATAQAGAVELSTIQILAPAQGLDSRRWPPYVPLPALRTKDGLPTADPATITPVSITISSGTHQGIEAAAPHLAAGLQRHAGDVVRLLDRSGDPTQISLRPPFDDSFWDGPARYQLTLAGELAWSPEYVGWVAELVADLSAQFLIKAPLLVTVTRQ